MLFIIDKKLPEEAKSNLTNYGKVIELETAGITNSYLSGHPDIFLCKNNNTLIVAPNLPRHYVELLKRNSIDFVIGENPVGKGYPECALYNAVIGEKFFIHKNDLTDNKILESIHLQERINVPQGFIRCNLIEIKPNVFITSDKSIFSALNKKSEILFVDPKDIILPEVKYGFFGGTCGVYETQFFICGSLVKHCEGEKVKVFLKNQKIEIVELYDGPLFDGGSILII